MYWHRLQANDADYEFEVTCSYCEVYNELIFDLLIPNSGPLYLRQPQLLLTAVSTAKITPDAEGGEPWGAMLYGVVPYRPRLCTSTCTVTMKIALLRPAELLFGGRWVGGPQHSSCI